jgi:predicted negative regulator of RcsB-dependent stress response
MLNEILKKNFLAYSLNFIKKKYKLLIILLLVLIIFLFAFMFYQDLNKKNNIQVAEEYTKATILIKQKRAEESKLLLESIINKNHQFYSPLALYLIIDNNIDLDDLKIISYFNKILKNNSIDKENLNLIKIKKAIYLINLDREEQVVKTLNPIINSKSVWRKTAINLISEYFLAKDQNAKAEEYIQLLMNTSQK